MPNCSGECLWWKLSPIVGRIIFNIDSKNSMLFAKRDKSRREGSACDNDTEGSTMLLSYFEFIEGIQ